MESCDTFVVMSDKTVSGQVIFGKNSDRPLGEVQEVVWIPSKSNSTGSRLQVCTLFLECQMKEGNLHFSGVSEWLTLDSHNLIRIT